MKGFVDKELIYKPCNLIVESIWFGCSGWIEEAIDKTYSGPRTKKNKITKGNATDQALLKFMLDNFYPESHRLIDTKIEVLHW